MRLRRRVVLSGLLVLLGQAQAAGTRLFAYNETAATEFTGVYLAPAGTTAWGPNQALNDADKALNTTERLVLLGVSPGRFDVKLVDRKGRTCVLRGVDLSKETSFEIRDADLSQCT